MLQLPVEVSSDIHMRWCGGSSGSSFKNLRQQLRQIRQASSFKRGFLKCRHYDSSIRTSIAITNKMNNSDATASASLNNYWSRITTRGDASQTYSLSWREPFHLWDKQLELAHMLSAQWILARALLQANVQGSYVCFLAMQQLSLAKQKGWGGCGWP